MRVLLLEDNADAALSLAGALQQFDQGYQVECAQRLADARELVRRDCPDVAIVDLGLPDADGSDTVVALRRHAPGLPLVVLTGRDFDSIARELVRAGVQEYLQKGRTSVRRIHEAIQLAVERHRLDASRRPGSGYDALTGALDRRELERRLGEAVARTQRFVLCSAVMIVGVDEFARINARCGPYAGERVLCEVARRLESLARVGDCIGRAGADEFAVVVEGLSCGEAAAAATRRVVESASFELAWGDRRVPVTVSVGVAIISDERIDAPALLRRADRAMRRARASGCGSFAFADGP